MEGACRLLEHNNAVSIRLCIDLRVISRSEHAAPQEVSQAGPRSYQCRIRASFHGTSGTSDCVMLNRRN